MSLEISDIIFYISSLKNPQDHFDISSRIKSFSSSTRASSNKKLIHNASPSHLSHHHFFFNRLPRLWNCLPPLDLNSSIATLKNQLKSIFWSHFISNFNPDNSCTFHLLCPCSTCSLSPPRLTQPQSHTLQLWLTIWHLAHIAIWPSAHTNFYYFPKFYQFCTLLLCCKMI